MDRGTHTDGAALAMNRDEILKVEAGTRQVETQAWGLVTIRQLTGADYGRVMAIMDMAPGAEKMAAFVVLGCTSPQFREEDIPVLARGPMEPLNEVAIAIMADAGMDQPAEKKSSVTMSTPPSTSRTNSATPIPIR